MISESLHVHENNNPITCWYGRVSLLTFFATSTSGGSPARRGLSQLHHGRRAKRLFQSDDWRCQHSSWLVFAQERYHWQLQHRCWRWNAGTEHRKRKYGCRTAALLPNTASGNTAVGSRTLLNNTTGGTLGNIQGVDVGPNVAVGQQALESKHSCQCQHRCGLSGASAVLRPASGALSKSVFARLSVFKLLPMPPAMASPTAHLATRHS